MVFALMNTILAQETADAPFQNARRHVEVAVDDESGENVTSCNFLRHPNSCFRSTCIERRAWCIG